MGVLSDRQIKSRCIRPVGFLRHDNRWEAVIPGVTHTVEQVENWTTRCYARFRPVTHDQDLTQYGWQPMIEPFVDHAVRLKSVTKYPIEGVEDIQNIKIISYGLSSYGYDIRLARDDIKIFSNINSAIVDPMRMSPAAYVSPDIHHDEEFGLDYFILPPKSVALGHTMEYFRVSRDLLVTCLGKSTYARVAMMPIVTPLEPEWEGDLVLEIANLIECPTKIYIGCGIAQLTFNVGDEVCEVSYKDRGGKYQGQKGTQDALV